MAAAQRPLSIGPNMIRELLQSRYETVFYSFCHGFAVPPPSEREARGKTRKHLLTLPEGGKGKTVKHLLTLLGVPKKRRSIFLG